jgi:hypothetical protein
MRARFPRLVCTLGETLFDSMLGAYLARESAGDIAAPHDVGAQLPEYLAALPEYPVWFAELARLDRAHVDVRAAAEVATLPRRSLTTERELKLIPASALVELTTSSDELWHAIDRGEPAPQPRTLDWPRTVLVWCHDGMVSDRTVEPDEAAALRAAQRGTTIANLVRRFPCANPHARAFDLVLRWIDGGVLAN